MQNQNTDLVAAADHLPDTEGESEKGMFTRLSVFRNTRLETPSGGVDDENGTIGLGSTSDHVLDKIAMSRGIDDGAVVLGGFKLPQGDINRDAALPLRLELVQHPGVLEGSLVHFRRFLLEALYHSLVDSSQFVDEMTRGCRLAGVDMSDDHDIDMRLLLSHLARLSQNKPRVSTSLSLSPNPRRRNKKTLTNIWINRKPTRPRCKPTNLNPTFLPSNTIESNNAYSTEA